MCSGGASGGGSARSSGCTWSWARRWTASTTSARRGARRSGRRVGRRRRRRARATPPPAGACSSSSATSPSATARAAPGASACGSCSASTPRSATAPTAATPRSARKRRSSLSLCSPGGFVIRLLAQAHTWHVVVVCSAVQEVQAEGAGEGGREGRRWWRQMGAPGEEGEGCQGLLFPGQQEADELHLPMLSKCSISRGWLGLAIRLVSVRRLSEQCFWVCFDMPGLCWAMCCCTCLVCTVHAFVTSCTLCDMV